MSEFSHIKTGAALGADHRMLAFFVGQAQNRLAMRAFAIEVFFTVTDTISLQTEKGTDGISYAYKAEIFALAACDLTRKGSPYTPHKKQRNQNA